MKFDNLTEEIIRKYHEQIVSKLEAMSKDRNIPFNERCVYNKCIESANNVFKEHVSETSTKGDTD